MDKFKKSVILFGVLLIIIPIVTTIFIATKSFTALFVDIILTIIFGINVEFIIQKMTDEKDKNDEDKEEDI